MRKLAFCIWENKDADQLCGSRTAAQRLCFHYIDSIGRRVGLVVERQTWNEMSGFQPH